MCGAFFPGSFLKIKIGLVMLAMILNANCSAVENAIKDAGKELAQDVGEQIEDKLSTASEEIKGEISGIKDDMKAAMEAAIASLRDELGAKVGDLNASLATLKETLPAEVSQQLEKLVTVVQDIKSVDDLATFFKELSELDSKMASLEDSIRTEVDTAIQPLHETLNQYDIKEFQSDLDSKVTKVEELINSKSFELKDELEGQITKARESIEGLANLRDIAFANNILVSVTQIINGASSDEDYKNALKEISKFTGDVIEGITNVAENINMEDVTQVAEDVTSAVANADLGNANVNVDVDVNVNQNSGNQAAPAPSPATTDPEPDPVAAAPSLAPTPTPNPPVPVAISAPPVDESGQVCEDYPATETSVFSDPCNPDITNWDTYTYKGYTAGKPETNRNYNAAVLSILNQHQKNAPYRVTPEAKYVYLAAINHKLTPITINYSASNSSIWVKSGVRANISGSHKTVYFEDGAIINGELMDESKNYSWAHYCTGIQPYYENCQADLSNSFYAVEDANTAQVPTGAKNIWVRYPPHNGGALITNGTTGSIHSVVVDHDTANTPYGIGNLTRYATKIFLLPNASIKLNEHTTPLYYLPGSEPDIFPRGISVSIDSPPLWPNNGLSYDRAMNLQHAFKSIFMCKNIELCRVE